MATLNLTEDVADVLLPPIHDEELTRAHELAGASGSFLDDRSKLLEDAAALEPALERLAEAARGFLSWHDLRLNVEEARP